MWMSANSDERSVVARRTAYDPNNLDPRDAEARQYDDTSEGIDWDEIIASTQDDFLAGRFAYNSAEYATEEEAMAALDRLVDDVLQKVLRETGRILHRR
jgi:hypothetical protein